jgi:hypothetical protein
MTITATGSMIRQTTFTLNLGPTPPVLQNGQLLSGLFGLTGSDQVWRIDVPATGEILDFSMNGVNGDADLYVGQGVIPTDDNSFCRSDNYGNKDSCDFYTTAGGSWYVRVHGSFSYSQVSLVATYVSQFTQLRRNVAVTVPSGTAGSWRYFYINAPAGSTHVHIRVTMLKGDVDLFVRVYEVPNPVVNDCASTRRGRRAETCNFKWRRPGLILNASFWIGVYGYTDYTNMIVRAIYTP